MYIFTKDLETGNPVIDMQHRELIEVVNRLSAACLKAEGVGEIPKTLSFLINYTNTHLADEEKLQLKSNYIGYEQHKQKHDNFKGTITLLYADHKKNPTNMAIVGKITRTLGDWLINHIKKEDLAMAKHLKS